jgi:hypothetical protein
MDAVQEALTFGLMIVVMITLFVLKIDWTLKIGIGALAFAVIFLAGLASTASKQQEEQAKKTQQ